MTERMTKIVATWGPAVGDEASLRSLIRAGVDVFRLNFSHGAHAEFDRIIPLIRSIASEEKKNVALLQDIQGSRLRTGRIPGGGPITLKTGSTIVIATTDENVGGGRIAIAYPKLANDITPGDRILIADGTLVLRATAVRGGEIEAAVEHGGMLGEHKGVNLPDSSVSAEALTAKDRRDLAYGARLGVDFVAMSFVRRAADVEACRQIIADLGGDTPVISKIEHPEAITNLEEILRASDGVMVARGDLGVEVSPERVPLLQKQIIKRANEMGIPVITATQMLESMVDRPVPTRAEASDVANAILDGTDALMLSAETAAGSFPLQSVETMVRIACETEVAWSAPVRIDRTEQPFVLARAARTLAVALDARALLVFTRSGTSAATLSEQRPPMPIYALTPSEQVACRLALWYGIRPIVTDTSSDIEQMIDLGMAELLDRDIVSEGDTIVVFGSAPVRVGGPPNLINVRTVPGTGL
jgi:pyruvate kinase